MAHRFDDFPWYNPLSPKRWEILLARAGEGEAVLIIGEKGSGKSRLAIELCKALGRRYYVMSGSEGLSESAFIGDTGLRSGKDGPETVQVDGLLLLATKEGTGFILNEISLVPDGIAQMFMGLTDGNRKLAVPHLGLSYEAAPGFLFIATCNPVGPRYMGSGQMNSALVDRFRVVRLDYMPAEVEVKVIRDFSSCDGETAQKLRLFADGLREAEKMGNPPSVRSLAEAAWESVHYGVSLREAVRECFINKITDPTDRDAAEQAAKASFSEKRVAKKAEPPRMKVPPKDSYLPQFLDAVEKELEKEVEKGQ